jgi:S1-C subfamily serine protease
VTAFDAVRTARATLLLLLIVAPAFAQRVAPAEATALVRLVGHVRVLRGEDERAWRERLLDLHEVEVGIGSGFIISPEGWVITNHHVVSDERSVVLVQGRKLEVSVAITGIEVVLPGDARQPVRRYPATVYAVDTDVDLALLRINGADLPYVALGDSDAVTSGEPVIAVGYPFGDLLELDKPRAAGAIPNPSVTTGAISALRTDVAGDQRHLQVSTILNPGNSGGPIADAEGYVVGVAQSRLRNASGIGFAVPINRVKRLLQSHGLESILPATLLAAGGQISTTYKGVTLAVPIGFDDRSTARLRVDAASDVRTSRVVDAASEPLALRIDRLATTYSLEEVERALLTEPTLEQFQMSGNPTRLRPRDEASRQTVAGYATGTDRNGHAAKLLYAIVDLGKEKIVARYTGAADTVAINRSLLQDSLRSLHVTGLLTAEVRAPLRARLITSPAMPFASFEGWTVEPGQPWNCASGLPPPGTVFAMWPPGDFTVAFRAAWYPASVDAARAAARACSPQPGSHGDNSYAARAAAWGIGYEVGGVFVPVRNGVWQVEMLVPEDKSRFVAPVFVEWLESLTR